MIPYYDMILSEEDDGVCQTYTDLSTEGLHYSAAFSNGNVAMMNMGSWFISTLISNLDSGGSRQLSLRAETGVSQAIRIRTEQRQEDTIATITGLAVTSASANKDAAFDFVNWVSGTEGAKVMASTGNFPAIMTDDVINTIAGMAGFPTDEGSKEALNITNAYLEVPYAQNVLRDLTVSSTPTTLPS